MITITYNIRYYYEGLDLKNTFGLIPDQKNVVDLNQKEAIALLKIIKKDHISLGYNLKLVKVVKITTKKEFEEVEL